METNNSTQKFDYKHDGTTEYSRNELEGRLAQQLNGYQLSDEIWDHLSKGHNTVDDNTIKIKLDGIDGTHDGSEKTEPDGNISMNEINALQNTLINGPINTDILDQNNNLHYTNDDKVSYTNNELAGYLSKMTGHNISGNLLTEKTGKTTFTDQDITNIMDLPGLPSSFYNPYGQKDRKISQEEAQYFNQNYLQKTEFNYRTDVDENSRAQKSYNLVDAADKLRGAGFDFVTTDLLKSIYPGKTSITDKDLELFDYNNDDTINQKDREVYNHVYWNQYPVGDRPQVPFIPQDTLPVPESSPITTDNTTNTDHVSDPTTDIERLMQQVLSILIPTLVQSLSGSHNPFTNNPFTTANSLTIDALDQLILDVLQAT